MSYCILDCKIGTYCFPG